MRTHWENLWRFETARVAVTLDCADESDPDTSWADADTLEKLADGIYVNVCFRVRVLLDGNELGANYIGNSVYENVRDFAREHYGCRSKGHYFPDMVRQAISEARKRLCETPRMRCA